MAYGNKFIKTQSEQRKPVRLRVRSPHGDEYTIDPWMDSTQMKPWELTAAIGYFLDLKLAPKKKQQKPNRFVHFQR